MLIVQTLLAFIVVIGILVTVHEFGHYWVARRLGVCMNLVITGLPGA